MKSLGVCSLCGAIYYNDSTSGQVIHHKWHVERGEGVMSPFTVFNVAEPGDPPPGRVSR